MLFTYPIAATADNWVSTTLLELLKNAVEYLQNAQEPDGFQESVPEEYQAEFARGTKFPDLYAAFVDQCRLLNDQQRDLVLKALAGQNGFPGLFAANTPCPNITVTLQAVNQATRSLFEYAFGKLSDLKTPGSVDTVRARYHQLVHSHIASGCCPFCGLEILEAPDPDLVDPDLDHYLAISKYPFAGANLRNLTAMGTTCNRSYKGAKDILLNELNQKVDCIDPYGDQLITISLAGTVLLPGGGQGPAWVLSFDPDALSQNWRRIFKLETRLQANVLEKQYQTWLESCVKYAQKNGIDISLKEGAIEAVRKFRDTCEYETFPAIARLKTNFFELVEAELNDPQDGDRMHNFVAAVQAA
ncbi:hypothetical protein [Mesorhizobium sp.]|uniref:hypothetical protein n=1 Tax=Mesorhizobium sp. TaxID=1871066 RepID=UPI000FE9E317|nr:hypothetical protein [Mesorhizobium sp.]RWQ64050.1 MAG: hypothetical protein EOS86_21960 [Mesorhizobium sp.]